jgi:hypothetical protein
VVDVDGALAAGVVLLAEVEGDEEGCCDDEEEDEC